MPSLAMFLRYSTLLFHSSGRQLLRRLAPATEGSTGWLSSSELMFLSTNPANEHDDLIELHER